MAKKLTETDRLLRDIELYVSLVGMPEWVFGAVAAGDQKLFKNLRSGKGLNLKKAERIRGYIADNPPPRRVRSKKRRRPLPAAGMAA